MLIIDFITVWIMDQIQFIADYIMIFFYHNKIFEFEKFEYSDENCYE